MNRLQAHLADHFDGKNILILGWGREGQSTYQLLQKCCPAATLHISDHDLSQVTPVEFEPYLEELNQYDVIYKTPGIPVRLPELQEYIKKGGRLTSQLNEFLAVYRSQTIGVTGTKGKSTTSSLVAHFLQALGHQTLLAGNIGTPVFLISEEITSAHHIVIEMSSYQLETVTHSPHIAVLLNLFPEHLNYHHTFENYSAAKVNIAKFQKRNDLFIYNSDIENITKLVAKSDAQKVPFSYRSNAKYSSRVTQILNSLSQTKLSETIRTKNVLPALLAVEHLLSSDADVAAVQASLLTFAPLPHRLEVIESNDGITWIDDTLATIPEATIAGLESLPNVDVLILGGYDRGITFDKVVDTCIAKKIPALLFFPPSGTTMYDLLRQKYPSSLWPVMRIVETMEEAVELARELVPEGGTVLLSPASPSFGQFKDYRDKSAQFRKWILKDSARLPTNH